MYFDSLLFSSLPSHFGSIIIHFSFPLYPVTKVDARMSVNIHPFTEQTINTAYSVPFHISSSLALGCLWFLLFLFLISNGRHPWAHVKLFSTQLLLTESTKLIHSHACYKSIILPAWKLVNLLLVSTRKILSVFIINQPGCRTLILLGYI